MEITDYRIQQDHPDGRLQQPRREDEEQADPVRRARRAEKGGEVGGDTWISAIAGPPQHASISGTMLRLQGNTPDLKGKLVAHYHYGSPRPADG